MPKTSRRVTLIDAEKSLFEFNDLAAGLLACKPKPHSNTPRWFAREHLYNAIVSNLLRFYDDYGDRIKTAVVLEALDKLFERKKTRPTPFRAGPVPRTGGRHNFRWWRSLRTTAERRANVAFQIDMAELELHVDQIGRRRDIPDEWNEVAPSREKSWKTHRATQWK